MADNKSKKGGQDRKKVAGGQNWEVRHVAEKLGVSHQAVSGAVRAVGNNRQNVEKYLKGKGK